MNEIQQTTLDRALKLLNALPLKYAIRTDDGLTFGSLQVVEPKPPKPEGRHKRKRQFPYGTVTPIVRRYCGSLEPGGVAQVPIAELEGIDPESLRGTITAWCGHNWGKGNYTTAITAEHVEVLRLA